MIRLDLIRDDTLPVLANRRLISCRRLVLEAALVGASLLEAGLTEVGPRLIAVGWLGALVGAGILETALTKAFRPFWLEAAVSAGILEAALREFVI